MRHKTPKDHWFGLRIQKEGQPWKWTNGTIFSNSFKIKGNGFCAYLDDDGASSSRCDTPRNWICTKWLHSDGWEEFQGLPTHNSSLDHGYQVTKKNCSVPENQLKEGGR
ncbi:C-type lectin domain family 2 member D-like [Sphaerodactylus townsendi]|uniref:C-type lectin domain family 2 member D-like n=1 Tax=Sphaerodactylus townsendi TaxID=933632 RepID=UPI00202700B9|nr:C-type lectin domain family 2 member D-like [Sphaerodactylus townsendi]